MDKPESAFHGNASLELDSVSKLVQDINRKVVQDKVKAKECEEFIRLKEKCCDKNVLVSLSAFHGIKYLVDKKILIRSQAVTMLVSLIPSVKQFGGLVSTMGNILLSDFENQISETGNYKWFQAVQFQHPFLIVLKSNWDKSWFEVYNFLVEFMKMNEDMAWEQKVKFIRPVYRQLFWSSSYQGSQLQLKLFNSLMMEFHEKEVMDFALETLLWQELNIHFCSYLQEFFIYLLKKRQEEIEVVAFGLSPLLAVTTKWLILNGYNPNKWLKILGTCVERKMVSGSTVLFILADVVMETPSEYILQLVDVCKSIIFSLCCSQYVAYKFAAVILNWFMNPSFLVNPIYKTLEKTLEFMTSEKLKWNDQTSKLFENEYYKKYGSSKKEAKFANDLIEISNRWGGEKTSIKNWLENFKSWGRCQMQLRVHSFIQGILLCEKDRTINNLCLEILLKLVEEKKETSFSLLCLLFYKLGKEVDPEMQKIYLFSLPRLSVKKENIPVIVGIIEALKRGPPDLMYPIVIQLFLLLWKIDNRTYSCLHNMLHIKVNGNYVWELNVSKVIALKEICKLAPHLHAKDLVGVLSQILNESSGNVSGLPSAIAIEAVTELCKAYVIDVSGTWKAIQPQLRLDKRPQVISSLCRFFGEIPNLNPSNENSALTEEIVPMLWDYSFSENEEVARSALRALSNFPIENLHLKKLPEIYRRNLKLPKDLNKIYGNTADVLCLPYVLAECWIQFLKKIKKELRQDGGNLVMVLVERELVSFPRGVFYLPNERPEPLCYSYLPPRSICRALLDHLLQYSKDTSLDIPDYVQEMIRVLAHEYSKALPPLNWEFLKSFMTKSWEFSRYCIPLFVKQASVSSSARAALESYITSTEWNCNKFEEILLLYSLMPLLFKVSYNILQSFLEQTIKLCLEHTLKENGPYFEEIIRILTKVLKCKVTQPGHKNLIATQMEKVLSLIPPNHEIMKKYAAFATEFPVKLVKEMTAVKCFEQVNSDLLRRSIAIRSAIALRSDINNPLIWLDECIKVVAYHPENQNPILNAVWFIIRNRRDCDHRSWVDDFILRTQIHNTDIDSTKASLFFVDLFITVVIILSGYDCLFIGVDEFINSKPKKLKIFPQALTDLLSSPDWSDMLPKIGLWLQKLSKWENLPQDHVIVLIETLLMLREVESFGKENEFSLFTYPLCT